MTDQSFSHLVIVGASAGGVDAFTTLLATLREDIAAPVLLAQHLDPAGQSHLDSILARSTSLPVRVVADREKLQPGVVYVVPSNHHVEITDSEVHLITQRGSRPMPSIDRLLTSAAHVHGEKLIAVILTGSGHDGAAGARAVKEAGGTVIIQNPATARYPAMPQSLAPTIVDIVAELEDIGRIVGDLVAGVYAAPVEDDNRRLRSFLDQLRERNGIDFTSYKLPTIMRRLSRRMAATGSTSIAEYIRHAQRQPDEYQRLISSFLIKVTEFFRDPELYTHLKEVVLPEIIENARRRGNELRLWSAGCATGEEAYSLAILVAEVLGAELTDFHIRIFATDLDNDAIGYARRGVYPAAALTDVPADLIERYFIPLNGEFEVQKSIRALTVFGQHDLGQRAPFPRIDLILCRNVLIYFTPELQRRALQLFAFSLRDDGLLVLGKAESANPLAEAFSLEHAHLKLFRRIGPRLLYPTARYRESAPLPPLRLQIPRTPVVSEADSTRLQREAQRIRSARDRAEEVLLSLPIGAAVVDRRYDIQSINNTARRLLGIHSPAIGDDLIHLVQSVSLAQLRSAIDAAFQGETTTTVMEVVAAESVAGGSHFLEITCYTQRLDSPDGELTDYVVVSIVDATAAIEGQRDLKAQLEHHNAESQRITEQNRRLTESNRQLLKANQELASLNAELRAANEEMLVAQEEVQAAAEEVETLNEELQASNEELETLNEELQATVEELNTTNDDLEARSMELQELAASLDGRRQRSESERDRLSAVLIAQADAVLVVDAQGHVLLSNRTYDRLFDHDDLTLLDESGAPLTPDRLPRARAARGEAFVMRFSLPTPNQSVRRYEAAGHPIDHDGAPRGGFVIIRELTPDRDQR